MVLSEQSVESMSRVSECLRAANVEVEGKSWSAVASISSEQQTNNTRNHNVHRPSTLLCRRGKVALYTWLRAAPLNYSCSAAR
jgi:hypothetical protein